MFIGGRPGPTRLLDDEDVRLADMDRVVHRRPTWACAIAMSSERIGAAEAMNLIVHDPMPVHPTAQGSGRGGRSAEHVRASLRGPLQRARRAGCPGDDSARRPAHGERPRKGARFACSTGAIRRSRTRSLARRHVPVPRGGQQASAG